MSVQVCACGGTGIAAGGATCWCVLDAQMQLRLRAAGVPGRYRRYHRLAEWEAIFGPAPRPLLDWPPQVVDERSWLVVLYGMPGRGKTGLGTAIFAAAQERMSRGRRDRVRGAWVDVATWVASMIGAMRKPGGSDEEFCRVRDAPLRMLDDLLAVRDRSVDKDGSPWWREQVALLLRDCEMHLRPTILTVNLVGANSGAPDRDTWPQGIGDRFDRSLVGRLNVEMAYELTGIDRRQA